MQTLNLSVTLAAVVGVLLGLPSLVIAQWVPSEVGKIVEGYQDDFEGPALQGGWEVAGDDVYTVANGVLRVTTAVGDPNHLLYRGAAYDPAVQEVLARLRILDFGSGDAARGGVATVVSADLANEGINYHFRDEPSLGQRHLEFLDDKRAWANEYPLNWQNNVWYWVRLRHEPDAPGTGAGDDGFAKIWIADGRTPEPASWQNTWNYTTAGASRTGYAGIVAGSSGGTSVFEVDYILIKAAGLPRIVVAPAAFPVAQVPVAITNQPLSQTVPELLPVTFQVGASGNPPPRYQWTRNGQLIPGATNLSYQITAARVTDDGAVFAVMASNTASNRNYSLTSSNALLTVVPDRMPPVLRSAESIGLSQVQATFSERINPATGTDRLNYRLSSAAGEIPISRVVLDESQTNVLLDVPSLSEGTSYELTVERITDQAAAANLVEPGSRVLFIAASYVSQEIGNAAPTGATAVVPGGYDVRAGGLGIGRSSDQFRFVQQARSGDFDVRVRVGSLGLADAWSQAGLMARGSIAPDSRFAAILATPTISGCYFGSRINEGSKAGQNGFFPVNYPQTWLRLKREGDNFTGFASFDGLNWTQVGSANLLLPGKLLLGFAVSSHQAETTTTASLREFSAVTSSAEANLEPGNEGLGQSSRLTSLVLSEIMYHPAQRADGKQLEFVELLNTVGTPEEISGYRLSGDVEFTFPSGTVIPGGGFLVVARNPADLKSTYGLEGVLGPFDHLDGLPNDQGTIRLRNPSGAIFLEVTYGSRAPWPVAADGGGHSLVLVRPSYGESDPRAWARSDAIGGSPGRLDPSTTSPLSTVVINEILARGADPLENYVELFNRGSETVDLSGCVLANAPSLNPFHLPANTSIGPRGFVRFTQSQLPFALTGLGETIYFKDPAGIRMIDAVHLPGQEKGVATGRSPDGADQFYRLQTKTPEAPNAPIRISDVVLNELLYDPITGNPDDQYIELLNRAPVPIALGGWRLTDGVDYTFPPNAQIPANGYLIVARNALHLRATHPQLTASSTLGDFSGKLSGSSERIVLTMPDPIAGAGPGTTNGTDIPIDQVTYQHGGQWGRWSNGGGSSLERIDPHADSRLAGNWGDSDESLEAPWTEVAVTGILDNGDVAADQLQVLLQGVGECLIDDVEVLDSAGKNQIANSTFESNANGWTAEGTEDQSSWELTEGYQSLRSYHVRAVERGDNQLNRIRTSLTKALSPRSTATIRAKVRWLKGHPEILFRLSGKWLEAVGTLDLPRNLGTPAAPNSRLSWNAPPALDEVRHDPILPRSGQPVVIHARASDPDGVSSLIARYRIDPGTSYSEITLRDNGVGGDAIAGDGIYSGTIPGQPAGTLVAFYLEAKDGVSTTVSTIFPNAAPKRECLIRFGESTPAGNFPVYRLWVTQATLKTWTTRSKLNNTPLDVTFVLGGNRVIYNALALYAGSPYISPGYDTPAGRPCGYSIIFPADNKLLGNEDLVLDWPGGHGNENTALQEQMGYWVANKMNLPYCHRYTIRLQVNGVTDLQRGTVFEAVNQPAGDFVRAWVPDDSDGDLFKIDRGFEFNSSGSLTADPQPRLENYTTQGGANKTAAYRFSWFKRSSRFANNYTNLFDLAEAVNAAGPEPYTSRTEELVDLEEWMGILATEHIIVNFDAYGHIIGKNMYAYKPANGKWQLYMFDLDWLMLAATGFSSSFAARSAPLFNCEDPAITRMYFHPPFQRAYYRAVQKAVDGPFLSANCDPILDAKYASLLANDITLCDGNALSSPASVKTWFSQRREFLVKQLATVSANFKITSPSGSDLTVTTNQIQLAGTAPITVKGIRVNGLDSPVSWTSVSNWSIRLSLPSGRSQLTVTGYDASGMALTNASSRLTVTAPGGGSSTAPVLINEWMASNHGSITNPIGGHFDDWFELFNPNEVALDLTGYAVTDDLAEGATRWPFPPASLISPHGYLLVWADDQTTPLQDGNGDLHVPFKLSQDGESIGLFAPDGRLVDSVRFSAQVEDETQGRWPDGSPDLVRLSPPTPRAANAVPTTEVRIVGASLEGSRAIIRWQSQPGSAYRIQVKPDLSHPVWSDLKEVQATGRESTIEDPLESVQQRFYRIQLLVP